MSSETMKHTFDTKAFIKGNAVTFLGAVFILGQAALIFVDDEDAAGRLTVQTGILLLTFVLYAATILFGSVSGTAQRNLFLAGVCGISQTAVRLYGGGGYIGGELWRPRARDVRCVCDQRRAEYRQTNDGERATTPWRRCTRTKRQCIVKKRNGVWSYPSGIPTAHA